MRFLSFLALVLFSNAAAAQSPLAGIVSSAEEGAMEGVLVSAKKVGSTITVTVVSDEHGRYAFPAKRLAPGRYTLGIRAVGYELEPPLMVTVTNKGSETQLKLKKAADLAAQLSNGESQTSATGRDRQEYQLLKCVC